MKNLKKHKDKANIVLPLPVADGKVAGDVALIGSGGLFGVLKTARATTATIAAGTAAQGLADGEASVELPGISMLLELSIATDIAFGAKVYLVTADGTYSKTSTGATFIGYSLTTLASAGKARVAIVANSN